MCFAHFFFYAYSPKKIVIKMNFLYNITVGGAYMEEKQISTAQNKKIISTVVLTTLAIILLAASIWLLVFLNTHTLKEIIDNQDRPGTGIGGIFRLIFKVRLIVVLDVVIIIASAISMIFVKKNYNTNAKFIKVYNIALKQVFLFIILFVIFTFGLSIIVSN